MNILIEALHGLGDTVCMLPTIRAIKHVYPNSKLTILLKFNINKEIIDASRIEYDDMVILDVYSKAVFSTIRKLIYLRRKQFDLAVCCANTPVKKAKLFMKLIKPKKVLGLQFQECLFFDELDDKYHFVDANFMSVASRIDKQRECLLPKLYSCEQSEEKMKKVIGKLIGKRIVGLCIGDGDISYRNRFLRTDPVFTRGWGIDNMIALAKMLIEHGYGVVLIGGKLEERLLRYVPDVVLNNDNLVNLVNKTTLKESMALVSLCNIVVGVDTGMMHIADALGIASLSIFGPTNPRTHGAYSKRARFVECECDCKYCYGTNLYTNCKERKCLNNISVLEVFNSICRCICKGSEGVL